MIQTDASLVWQLLRRNPFNIKIFIAKRIQANFPGSFNPANHFYNACYSVNDSSMGS
jgi:hypothetical protein